MPTIQITLPDIGEGIAEAEIVKWLVKEGDSVKRFQPIVEVLTAKAVVEIPSPHTGILKRILAKEGETVKVGDPIAEIETGETPTTLPPRETMEKQEQPPTPTPPAKTPSKPRPVKAPPSVRMLARKHGIDLSQITGTGPRGVITKKDLEAYIQQLEQPPTPPPTQPPTKAVQRIPLRGVRKIMADRMTLSKTTIPHAYVVEEADITELLQVRSKLKPLAEKKNVRLTLLAFILKAVVHATREYPLLNSSLDPETREIILHPTVNLGIAVDTENGLMVPVIKDAQDKTLFQLAHEINRLATLARENKLTLQDVTGSTITVSNYGAIGGILGIPAINPPEAAIIGVGRARREPRYTDEETIQPRTLIYLTLSFDHRILEGGYATRYLLRIKQLLENPIELLAAKEATLE